MCSETFTAAGIPYRIRLLSHGVKRTDVSPKLFSYSDHILHRLNDWGTEVHSEIRIIVVTSGVPAFYPVILMGFLMIYQRLYCDGTEVVGIPIGRIVDGTWLRLFWVCCESCRAEEERQEGGG